MKILLCGGSGLLGRSLYKQFIINNIECIATYNTNKLDNFIKLDFLNYDQLYKNIKNINPDICISNIAERKNEICENNWDKIKNINITIPYHLAKICSELKIYLIHISTDYVYDGQTPPFDPQSLTNPLQNYGISKLIAEKRIESFKNLKYLILRVPVLYSDNLKNFTESAVTVLANKVMNKLNTFNEDNFCIRRPLFIKDLCLFILDIINKKKFLEGIHCFYNPFNKYTKYDIIKIISKILNKNIDHINPLKNQSMYKALRPFDTQLKDEDIHIQNYNFTNFKESLYLCLKKIIHPPINLFKPPINSFFFLLDLDGTLIDSELIHYNSYKSTIDNFIETYEEFIKIAHKQNLDEYLKYKYNITDNNFKKLKINKNNKFNELVNKSTINIVENADKFIDFIDKYDINHCVVTNTCLKNVEILKQKCLPLNKLKNWITRENYLDSKPSPDGYLLAKKKYFKNENYIIGFENSVNGYNSLKHVTDIIYFICNDKYYYLPYLNTKDIYLIKNYLDI